ncbi:extracellular solute-binding protein [Oryzifoliimicrobium ureilyticus]|uniref:extracellular solute-binding protein n=1 Tax=Oryzifoliimicrobium ureilyticus TaxID=3113724 RepID=UPI0030766132
MARSRLGLLLMIFGMAISLSPASAQEPQFRVGVSSIGEVKYKPGFAHFDYVDPNAPKGGDLQLSQTGTFDSFNPILGKGSAPAGVAPSPTIQNSLVFETLMKSSLDEALTSYGLLAEGVSFPDDVSSATFRLRAEAKWADGSPVTVEDVIFSFDKSKELNPLASNYYGHVTKAEKTGPRDVTFTFDEKGNKELPNILGQLVVVPKAWWEGKAADGTQRDISKTTLEPVMGSGPYKIASFSAGSKVTYERRDDYWGRDINVNVGQNNFRTISVTFFGDRAVEFEALRGGNIDFWQENQASRWATGYDFPAVKDGRLKREQLPNGLRGVGIMQAMVPNMRRDMFKDERVREALNYAFDFEELNRTVFFGAYQRCDSFFYGTELASSGLPQGRELEILNGMKDQVPSEIFTKPYANPIGGDPQKSRDNLRKAVALLKEAGYDIKGSRMVNTKTGQPLSFEILLNSAALERAAVPYANNLRKIGIDARVRTVDASQYVSRMRSFDFDMTWYVWAQTLNPGNEQVDYWGSKSVNQQGSHNYAGIADPAVDALVKMIIFAPNREEQVAPVKAMDRVLLERHYVVPLYYARTQNFAYSDKLARPAELPEYAIGFPDIWWSKDAK